MRRFLPLLLALLIVLCSNVFAETDDFISGGSINGTYHGTLDAETVRTNIQFRDVPANHWARRPIVRNAALELITGYERMFYPSAALTNEEAITLALKAIGLEREALARAAALQDSSLRTLWSLGYLSLAADMGLIDRAEYNAALTQTAADAGVPFSRLAPAKREDVARWIVAAFNSINPDVFPTQTSVQKIFSYSDYNSISASAMPAVEIAARNGIMSGYPDRTFRPLGNLTRAEMAQILYNLEEFYFSIAGIEKKSGTIGFFRDNQIGPALWRNIYVRVSDGTADMLQYELVADGSPQPKNRDALTLKNNIVSGMAALTEGDTVTYYVRSSDGSVLFVESSGEMRTDQVTAKLFSVDPAVGTINLVDAMGKHFIYSAAEGMFSTDGMYFRMEKKDVDIRNLPFGSGIRLTLNNNVAVEAAYVGEPTLVQEIRGIVTENNPGFGYITIVDNNGREVTKRYYESEMTVKKRQYYDISEGIGYINEMFPDFRYDPRDTVISAVEPGDIVYLRLDPANTEVVVSVSASTDYVARYGRIVSVSPINENDYAQILVEYENKQTAWFTVAREIFVSSGGRPSGLSGLRVGDWAKFLINQAVIAPGYVLETVKEIAVEGGGHLITAIIKGNFAGVNSIQNRLLIENSYLLSKTGWGDYNNLSSYPLSGRDVEYYHNGQRITLDYAARFFKFGDVTAYIALEGNFSGQKAVKVTFRTERDELLPADTVTDASAGRFDMLGNDGSIRTDAGTIVLRHGRLVSGNDILPADYANVSLNGLNAAAIVEIIDAPETSLVAVARGRVYSIDEGKSFKVQSMSLLSGLEWVYTPIQREFTIDHNTLFIDAGGYVDPAGFMGYTENSKLDKVYYIIIDGSRAAYIIDAPYATKAVRGTVYRLENGMAYIKEVFWYDDTTGKWNSVSNTNAILQVAIAPNTILAKNNSLITQTGLNVGDSIRVMTYSLPSRVDPGSTIEGNIIFVER